MVVIGLDLPSYGSIFNYAQNLATYYRRDKSVPKNYSFFGEVTPQLQPQGGAEPAASGSMYPIAGEQSAIGQGGKVLKLLFDFRLPSGSKVGQ